MVKSTSQNLYRYKLNQLKAESVVAYEDFCKRGPQAFCKSLLSPFTKSDMIENNICETFNAFILKAREKPLIEMLEDIRRSLMSRMYKIAISLSQFDDILCPNIRKKLDKLYDAAKFCELIPAVGGKFEVQYFDEVYIVDLERKECSCNVWVLTGLPCSHAMACVLHARESIEKYVDEFYYRTTCIATYRHSLSPIGGFKDWPYVDEPPVWPPHYTRQPGRPKKKRRRDQHELKKSSNNKLSRNGIKMTCSRCGQIGHNKRTCDGEIQRARGNHGVQQPNEVQQVK